MPFDASFLSPRTQRLAPSGIRKFFDLAATMPDALNLSLGQPHFDVPPAILNAAHQAMDDGHNRYTATAGIPPLRKKVRDYLERTQKLDTKDDEVIITAGVSGGLMLAYFCLLQDGDDVMIPEPYFIEYLGLASMTGARPVWYNTYPDFRLRVEELEKVRTPKTKVLVVNSPQNPTGTMYTEAELKAVAEWARKHGIFIITDEIYELFSYDKPHISIKRFYPEGTALVSGFGKTYGMPGWRVGYALFPKFMFDKSIIIQSYSFVCAPTPLQYASLQAFDVDMTDIVASYKKKRDLVYNGLREFYPVLPPPGSFYIFPEVPPKLQSSFIDRVLAKRLLVVPGTAFSQRPTVTHFRLSFAAPDEQLEKGVKLLREIATEAT